VPKGGAAEKAPSEVLCAKSIDGLMMARVAWSGGRKPAPGAGIAWRATRRICSRSWLPLRLGPLGSLLPVTAGDSVGTTLRSLRLVW